MEPAKANSRGLEQQQSAPPTAGGEPAALPHPHPPGSDPAGLQLQQLLAHTPIGLMLLQPDPAGNGRNTRIVSANSAAIDLLAIRDIEPPELSGKTIAEVIPADCATGIASCVLSSASRGGAPSEAEIHRQDAEAADFFLIVRAFPLPGGFVGLALVNITPWRLDQEALRRSEAQFRSFLDSAPDAVVITGQDGQILLVNSQAERMFGYTRDELAQHPVELLVPERLREQHRAHRRRFSAEARVRPMGTGLALLGRRKDGREFPVEISLSPITTEGSVVVCSAIRDVTERQATEEALKRTAKDLARSNDELRQFAHVASHDLQEPLRTIAFATQLLARDYQHQLDPRALDHTRTAIEGVKRMQVLINELLNYADLSVRRRAFEMVDCEKSFQAAVSNLMAALKESGAVITHEPLPTVLGDSSQLTQLLQNLLANAIKFRRQASPQVHVSARLTGLEWELAVRDNGIGIDPKYFSRLFNIFQRLHHRDEYPGTGIGLALCKKIVEQHGGRIWIESTPGQGSTFYFTFPVPDRESAMEVALGGPPPSEHSAKTERPH